MDTGPVAGRPTVILVHGILVSSWAWRLNIEALATRFRVIAVCQKGHGWSDAPEGCDYSFGGLARFVVRVMDALGVERAHLVGNSLGGAVCMHIALEVPDRVDRIVLVDSAGVPFRYVGPFLALQSPRLERLYRLVIGDRILRTVLRAAAYRRLPIDDEFMRWFSTPLRRRATVKAAASISRQLYPSTRRLFPRLPNLRHEVRLIWGRHDRLVPVRAGEILHQVLPNSSLTIFEDCAHCAMEEAPHRFNRHVLDFLSGVR